jgi:glycosyltransferase involved in cell wall biosynthesis
VTTFHDLFVMMSEYSTADFRRRFTAQARDAAERSDLVIAVSEFTAGQVQSLLGVDRGRIRVAPHGVEPLPAAAVRREPVILFLGALQARKNVVRLVEAFEQIRAPGWRLVLAGSHGYGAADILARIERSSRRSAIDLPGFVTNERRGELYSRASLFAFPSLDEGFGIPVLEAMAAELPVLTSNRSSLPEVAGQAALLVDPTDVTAIAAGLQTLIDDSALRTDLAARGRERASEFTWERTVATTWKVYQELRE